MAALVGVIPGEASLAQVQQQVVGISGFMTHLVVNHATTAQAVNYMRSLVTNSTAARSFNRLGGFWSVHYF